MRELTRMPLIVVRGPTGPPVKYRFEKATFTVGRSEENDLVLADPDVSRLHLELRRGADGFTAADRGSRNGTRLNGRPLERETRLSPGDRLGLGAMTLVFEPPERHEPDERAGAGDGAPAGDRATWTARGTGRGEEEPSLIGESPVIRRVRELIERVAPTDATVLLTGENGTGKGVAARLLHRLSGRASGPFVVVNCPALPGTLLEAELFGIERGVATGVEPRRGRLESAAMGTLFLDEVGDMDLVAQAKLLQFFETRRVERVGGRVAIPVDARLVAATNHDLEAAVARGAFRRDLLHRLDFVRIELPPLRARKTDIPLLVAHALARREGPQVGISSEALEVLLAHDYPGNVRELLHAVGRARLLADGPLIRPQDLPASVRRPAPPGAPAAPSGGGAKVEAEAAESSGQVAALYRRLVGGESSFWDAVHRPFLDRELAAEDVRKLVALAYAEGGYSYKGVARLFRIEAEHKRLLNFLNRHGLGVRP